MCRCVECLGTVGVYMYMCGVPRDCGCVDERCVGCGCVHVWICGVPRDCGCVDVWSA